MSSHHEVVAHFKESYGISPEYVVRAPGRINLIGEHTDYNQGWVLPAAIDKALFFAVKRNGSSTCNLTALDVNEQVSFTLPIKKQVNPLWGKYAQGACKVIMDRDKVIGGFDCVFGGDIPIGSGLSSSAALDCGLIKSISLLHQLDLPQWDVVEISNVSNNQFLGIQSGILDQFASVFGKEGTCMSLDCRSREYGRYPVDFGDHELVLINSNVKHEHSDSGYNDRPAECRQAVISLQELGVKIKSLRELTMDNLLNVKEEMSPKLFARSKFIIEENARVASFVHALQTQDIGQLGALLYDSHHGLQHQYQVSCEELDLLVDLTREVTAVAGSRMMGGGFGGCTLNLIKSSEADRTVREITTTYKEITSINPAVYKVKISNGVEVL